jgi:hypothetical protein
MSPDASLNDVAERPALLFHASPSANRASICAHGLDVSRMSVAGIAGSPDPEEEGVHLAEGLWEGFWYASFDRHPRVDIWQVQTSGLRLRDVNEGWVCEEVIPPERLTLAEADLAPSDAIAWLDAQNKRRDPATSGLTGYIDVTLRETSDDPPSS